MRHALIAALFTGIAATCFAAPSEYNNIMPEPRQMQITGEQIAVVSSDLPLARIVVSPRQRQAQIGAEEINDRLTSLGSPALPVIEAEDAAALDGAEGLTIVISKCYGSALAEAIIDECDLDVSRDAPGTQGYIIRFVNFRGHRIAFLCGSDPVGSLYAAVTFRWLLERDGDQVLATICSVRDWPDFLWRGTGSLQQMRKSYPVYGARDTAEALKVHADWMLRHKLNFFGDYFYGNEKVPAVANVGWMRPFNAYLRERGMIGEEYQSTNVGYDERDKDDPRFAGMMHTRDLFFSWSDDELIRKRAREIGEFYAAAGLDCVVLHAPDGGGPLNPEMWENRSHADRERWGDDRAAADAHIFGIFYEEIRAANPRARVVFVIYPYSAFYLDWEGLKQHYPEMTREQFESAGREHFRRVSGMLPEDAHICVWLGEREYLNEFRGYYGDMPMYYWYKVASGWVDSGWLVTVHRFIPTCWYGHPDDIMASRIDRNAPNFMNRAVACQFAWNTESAGAEPFAGTYYDFRTDNTQPREVMDRWGLRACRSMWGSEVGPIIFEAYNKGVIPALIVQPTRVFEKENRRRRMRGLEPFTLTPEMMLAQADACAAAAEALDQVLAMDVTMDDLAERLYVYLLRNSHCLSHYARAHYHLLLANEGVAEGDEQKVTDNVAAGQAAIEAGLEDMVRVLEITAEMRSYDPKYAREAEAGVFPAIPGTTADFPRLRESLDACLRRFADSQLQFEPIKHEGPISVAIYDPGDDGGSAIGHRGWMMTLEGSDEFAPEFIDDLSLSTLVNYEVLLYPQCNTGRSAGRYEFFEVLGRYVREAGGGVLFGHNSIGTVRSEFGMETAFPRIGLGALDRFDSNQAVVAGEHPITEGLVTGAQIQHAYYDHWTIKSGSRGIAILSDSGGDPIMVAGRGDQGRVIYDGTIMLSQTDEAVAAEGEWREVFLNAIRWLARRK